MKKYANFITAGRTHTLGIAAYTKVDTDFRSVPAWNRSFPIIWYIREFDS